MYTKKQETFLTKVVKVVLDKYVEGDITIEEVMEEIKKNKVKFPTTAKKVEKDPDKPKRAKNAFMYYTSEMREKVAKENEGKKPAEIAKLLGEMWNSLTESDKEKYVKQNEKDKERYKKEMEEYNKKNGGEDKEEVEMDGKNFEKYVMGNYKSDVNESVESQTTKIKKVHDKVKHYMKSQSEEERVTLIEEYVESDEFKDNSYNVEDFKNFLKETYA